mmetsp:Transcript_3116/g.7195  ORF Transcript_3116/g.7195 Transcript_3116/m.7195 type:complete len:106 (+) Transcript_3116:430-747(+)
MVGCARHLRWANGQRRLVADSRGGRVVHAVHDRHNIIAHPSGAERHRWLQFPEWFGLGGSVADKLPFVASVSVGKMPPVECWVERGRQCLALNTPLNNSIEFCTY